MRQLDFGAPCGLDLACRLLRAGEVLILPTETLYGFSALGLEPALRRIQALKARPPQRGFLALLERFECLAAFVHPAADARALALLRRVWPAPLTAVLPVREALPWGEALESGPTAAFRVPAHPRLRRLLAKLGAPLVSTSVNKSGAEPLRSAAAIAGVFGSEDDLWLFRDRGLEKCAEALGSTVADMTVWPPQVLRRGRFDVAAALSGSPGEERT